MVRCCRLIVLLVGCWTWSGCGSTPTAPDPLSTRPADGLIVTWHFGTLDSVTSVGLLGFWVVSREQGSNRSAYVTGEAAWESSAPGIATIVAPGQIMSVSPGDAELRVSFRGTTLTRRVRVYAGEAPLWVVRPGEESSIFGSVIDTTIPPSQGAGIAGARVEILTGHNAGRSAISDTQAHYRFEAPLVCGAGTVRATKPGYRDATASSVFCEDSPALGVLWMTPAQ